MLSVMISLAANERSFRRLSNIAEDSKGLSSFDARDLYSERGGADIPPHERSYAHKTGTPRGCRGSEPEIPEVIFPGNHLLRESRLFFDSLGYRPCRIHQRTILVPLARKRSASALSVDQIRIRTSVQNLIPVCIFCQGQELI